jgi:predicted nucleic acid-binding protein
MSVLNFPGLFFLDTNIFVYSFDVTAPHKQQTARDLIRAALSTQRGVISAQVMQEFLNVALRKFTQPMTIAESQEYLKITLLPLCRHYPCCIFLRPSFTAERSNRIFFLRFFHCRCCCGHRLLYSLE